MATALVPNLGGFLVLRLLSGLFSSVTIGTFAFHLSPEILLNPVGLSSNMVRQRTSAAQ